MEDFIKTYIASPGKTWDWKDIKRWTWELIQKDGFIKTVEHHLYEDVLYLDTRYDSIDNYIEVDSPYKEVTKYEINKL